MAYELGDTVRFRVINASVAAHPMHLHGFYFNVESRGDAGIDSVYDRSGAPDLVVTERLVAGRTIAMSWIPDRAGNWLFHCHDNYHVLRNSPLDGSSLPPEQTAHVENHALEMMGGLVMGIEVKEREPATVTAQGSAPRRQLRLIARADSGGTAAEPSYGYVLSDGRATTRRQAPLLPGPTIVLKRGQPVSITVVNELREPTAVHWHGIELESYYDGVADFAGIGRPAPLELRAGDRYRLRIVDIHTFRPAMIVRIERDSTLARWRPLAKDGMDLPATRAVARPARQQMGNGETYDFEFMPTTPGDYRLNVTSGVGVPLNPMLVRVR